MQCVSSPVAGAGAITSAGAVAATISIVVMVVNGGVPMNKKS